MQIILMMLLLFSDSFAFGLQSMFGYPTWAATAWTVGTFAVMALPYFRHNEAAQNNQAA